jgi:hypothetical protein
LFERVEDSIIRQSPEPSAWACWWIMLKITSGRYAGSGHAAEVVVARGSHLVGRKGGGDQRLEHLRSLSYFGGRS